MRAAQTKLILQTQAILMESTTLCLSYYRPPSMLLDSPASTLCLSIQRRATKLRPSHSSLPLSSGSRRRPLGQVISPVIRASDSPPMPPENGEGDNEAPPASISALQFGASLALQSFLDVSAELASSEAAEPSYKLPIYEVPPGPSMEDVKSIKMEALRQMKLGNPDKAVKLLRDVYEVCKNEPEPAYNLEMALVQVLIYQGRYEEALNCNCLKDEQPFRSDAQFRLYKAIICTMLNKEEARKWWEKFAKTIEATS